MSLEIVNCDFSYVKADAIVNIKGVRSNGERKGKFYEVNCIYSYRNQLVQQQFYIDAGTYISQGKINTALYHLFLSPLALSREFRSKSISFQITKGEDEWIPVEEKIEYAHQKFEMESDEYDGIQISIVVWDARRTNNRQQKSSGNNYSKLTVPCVTPERWRETDARNVAFVDFSSLEKKISGLTDNSEINVQPDGQLVLEGFEPDRFKRTGPKVQFGDQLMKTLRKKNIRKNSSVYTEIRMTRFYFSNILNNHVIPCKDVAILLAIALQLSYEEAIGFLECAGYTLSEWILRDRVFINAFKNKCYDLYDINDELHALGLDYLAIKEK